MTACGQQTKEWKVLGASHGAGYDDKLASRITTMSDSNTQGRRFIELRKHRRVTPPPGSLLSFAAIVRPDHLDAETEGDGAILNLSPGGCMILSDIGVMIGRQYQLIIQSPSALAPIIIDSAIVRWAHPHEFGVKIVSIGPDQEERLLELFQRLRSTAL